MAYQASTVVSSAELKTTIQNFAVTNGWSLSGGWLSKGLSHVSLSSDSPQAGYVGITGACSSDGLTNPAGFTRYVYVPVSEWPVYCYLFAHTNPDIISCVILSDTDMVQHLIFGDIIKINSTN